MLNLNGAKLPDTIKLSACIRNQSEAVRVTGLRPGQTLEVDVSLDGGNLQPDKPTKEEKDIWIGPTGLEGVHTGLLAIVGGKGFTLNFGEGIELRNSRGRGLTFANCSGFTVNNPWIKGARTAGITGAICTDFTINYPVTVNTGNYQPYRTDVNVHNVPGSIKFDQCKRHVINWPISVDHIGNGLTDTECDGGTWNDTFTYAVYGANHYINATSNSTFRRALAVGSKSFQINGFVVNSEEENKGIRSENAIFDSCLAIDNEWAVGVWGNEQQIMTLKKFSLLNSILIAKNLRTKLSANTTIKAIDESGTIYLDPAKLADGILANLRAQAATLADLVRSHASWPMIAEHRAALLGAMEELRGPIKPPVDPPGDDTKQRVAALEATVAGLVAQQAALGGAQERMSVEWVGFMERVKALPG